SGPGRLTRAAGHRAPLCIRRDNRGGSRDPALNCPALLNLSFTLHGRTTRATGGTMREFIPGSVRCPFAVTRIPCPRGLLGRATILCPRNVSALASGPNRPQLFLI